MGGEDLRTDLAKRIYESFGGHIEIYNEYGPTETVVGCMIHRYNPKQDVRTSVPIGIPCANTGIHILDCDGNPVPEGVIGELYITGDGLARGYRNMPNITAERFVPCPFLPGERMYRTGDLARRLEDGTVEYAGRGDMQVKIRGHRIELGEIERVLADHPSVREAIVIDRTSDDGRKYLCAYIVQSSTQSEDWSDYLSQRLPAYMVPAHIVKLEHIPLNVNGKVDRNKLPAPDMKRSRLLAGCTENSVLNPAVSVLLAVAMDVLHVNDIHTLDHFYTLGGDSIKAIQLASRLRSRGYRIKVADVLAHPVFEDMSHYVQPIAQETAHTLVRSKGVQRSTPIIDWFMTRPFSERNHFVQSVLLRLDGELTAQQLDGIVETLINRHDSLRLNIDLSTDTLIYNDNAIIENVSVYDLSHLTRLERQEQIKTIGERLKASFRLDRDALLKACLFELGEDGRRLLLTAHHLAVDAVSWSILLEELGLLHGQYTSQEPVTLPTVTASYQLWAEHLWSRKEEMESERSYWQALLDNETYIQFEQPACKTSNGVDSVSEELSQESTEQLLQIASTSYGSNVQELLAAALASAIWKQFDIEKPVIELEGHGREPLDPSIELSKSVGWFTAMYPVRLQADADDTWERCIKSVKETLRTIPSRGISYGILTRLLRTLHDPGEGLRIRFNYVGQLDTSLHAGAVFELSDEETGADIGAGNPMTTPLDIVAMVLGGKLKITVRFDRSTVRSETAVALTDSFIERTESLIRHCLGVHDRVYTPSDFSTISLSQEALDSLYR
ncbi:hypothetical protein PCURB6_32650 [Paenibacillus curdlanolyticus]|nr:condensation domain-containing protein [Paenibacillus curdlanolyticus]GFN33005.1 hypothetical protein PCURB6_32650 [Paenibacillus curdlanolyticus]